MSLLIMRFKSYLYNTYHNIVLIKSIECKTLAQLSSANETYKIFCTTIIIFAVVLHTRQYIEEICRKTLNRTFNCLAIKLLSPHNLRWNDDLCASSEFYAIFMWRKEFLGLLLKDAKQFSSLESIYVDDKLQWSSLILIYFKMLHR